MSAQVETFKVTGNDDGTFRVEAKKVGEICTYIKYVDDANALHALASKFGVNICALINEKHA